MSEQRWTIYVCDCGDAYDSTSFVCGFCGPAKETVVVPESELSLSLAREQRLRDDAERAENEWSAYSVTLSQRLERLEALARRRGVDDVAIRDALSSVPDGEQS